MSELETGGLIWAELTQDDVLVGQLNPENPSRLGRNPNEPGLHADLDVAPDATGKILLRVPPSVAPDPDQVEELIDLTDLWEPRFDDVTDELVGARGLLHYATRVMPWGEVYLEIIAEEAPFG